MQDIINFSIKSKTLISELLKEKEIHTFHDACNFISKLPYARNKNKNDLASILIDNCGTCSTKHAILKKLADENEVKEIKLFIGIFKLQRSYSNKLDSVFDKHNLEYIPEAHCYLKIENEYFDFTTLNSKPSDFINELMDEIEIRPEQIGDFKIDYHKSFIKDLLNKNQLPGYSFDEIWKIREDCIQALSI